MYVCKRCGSTSFNIDDKYYTCKACGAKYNKEAFNSTIRPVIAKPVLKDMKKLSVKPLKPDNKKEIKPITPIIKHVASNKKSIHVDSPYKEDLGLLSLDSENLLESLSLLLMDAYNNRDYERALAFSDKLISLYPDNSNAYFYKGMCLSILSNEYSFRLNEAMECFVNALAYIDSANRIPLEYKIKKRIYEAINEYSLSTIKEFKEKPNKKYTDILRGTIDYLEPIINLGYDKLHLNRAIYYEGIAISINKMLGDIFNASYNFYSMSKANQTDSNYLNLINTLDCCIDMWSYLVTINISAHMQDEILLNLSNAYRVLVKAVSYTNIDTKPKKSLMCSKKDRAIREEHFNELKAYLSKRLQAEKVAASSTLREINYLNLEIEKLEERKKQIPESVLISNIEDENKLLKSKINDSNRDDYNNKLKDNNDRIIRLKLALFNKSVGINQEINDLNIEILRIKLKYDYYKI